MPRFLNTNSHYIYLELPEAERDLTRYLAFEEFELSGANADVAEDCNGVVNLDTADDDQLAAIADQLHARELAGLAQPGKESSGDPDDASPAPTIDVNDLDSKGVTELRKLAKAAGVTGMSKAKKPQLLEALKAHAASTSTGDTSTGPITTDTTPTKGK
jgi:hypothetical protein